MRGRRRATPGTRSASTSSPRATWTTASVEFDRSLEIAYAEANVDDIGRGYVNLVSGLLFGGYLERAAEAAARGMRDADAYGITSTYGTFIGHNAVMIDIELGQLGPRGGARAGPGHRAVEAAREPVRPRPLDPPARRAR